MRITINDVKQSLGVTETYDIVNAIRNSLGTDFQRYVPLANADNVLEVGHGIMINQTVQNEFLVNLIDRIGLVVIKSVSLSNPLAKFKKGQMPTGRTIEEIFVDITQEKQYDPEESETTVFKREIPNVKVLFHERNRQGYYEQTIQDDSLKSAFVSWNNFDNFLVKIIKAIYNSAEVDEFKYMKLLIDNYHSKGLFHVIPVAKPDTKTATQDLIKKIRTTATLMTLPMGTRDFNSLAVHTRCDMDDLHLIIDANLQAQIDVDVLAAAFNMGKTDFMGHVTVIDKFASKGLEAVLIDRDWYMVYDTLQKLETIRNPRGLYWNYFYHVWQVLSVSRFSNAVAFVSGDVPAVTQVIVDPVIASVKAGRSFEFTSYVRANKEREDGQPWDAEWLVTATNGSQVANGTAISQDGVLSLAPEQTGELMVTARVNIGTAEKADYVKGESIVTVIPS